MFTCREQSTLDDDAEHDTDNETASCHCRRNKNGESETHQKLLGTSAIAYSKCHRSNITARLIFSFGSNHTWGYQQKWTTRWHKNCHSRRGCSCICHFCRWIVDGWYWQWHYYSNQDGAPRLWTGQSGRNDQAPTTINIIVINWYSCGCGSTFTKY